MTTIRSISSFDLKEKKLSCIFSKRLVTKEPNAPVSVSRMHIVDIRRTHLYLIKNRLLLEPCIVEKKALFHFFYPDLDKQKVYHFCVDKKLSLDFANALHGPIRSFVLDGAPVKKAPQLVKSLQELLHLNENYQHTPRPEPSKEDKIKRLTTKKNTLWNEIERLIKSNENIANKQYFDGLVAKFEDTDKRIKELEKPEVIDAKPELIKPVKAKSLQEQKDELEEKMLSINKSNSTTDKADFDQLVKDYEEINGRIAKKEKQDLLDHIDREINKGGDINELIKKTDKLAQQAPVINNFFGSQNTFFKPRRTFLQKVRDFFVSLFCCFRPRGHGGSRQNRRQYRR